MKNGTIIYQSKYGSAKKYAEWPGQMTGFRCVEISEASRREVAAYQSVVLCGGIYASGIAGLPFLKKNMEQPKDKKTAVLCAGASPCDEKAFAEIKARNLTGNLRLKKIHSPERSGYIRTVDESPYARRRTKL